MSAIQSQPVLMLRIPTNGKTEFVKITNILYVQALSNYIQIFLQDKKCITFSKTLKQFESCFSDSNFIRCHRSHIVNMNYVETYLSGKNAKLVLQDGSKIPVSKEGWAKILHFTKCL